MRSKRLRKSVHAPRRGVKGGIFLFALFFASFMLLVLSRLENQVVRDMRGQVSDWATPVLEWASLPAVHGRRLWERGASMLTLQEELDRLRAENDRLRQWEWRVLRMERRLGHLRSLLHAVDEQALDHATGRVIADARGPFARSILVNVGREQGVKQGYAVIDGDGLVGRAVHVGEKAARVILLNDLNSRIPVLVGPSAVRAVLVGDNARSPRLEFMPDSSEVFEHDEVYTSGHAGMLPRGLRIGVVESGGEQGYRVRPAATLSELEFVSILFFDSPLVMAADAETAPQKDRTAAKSAPAEGRPRALLSEQPVRRVRALGAIALPERR